MFRPVLTCLLLAQVQLCLASDWLPERRKDQNPTQPAHLIVPLPYSKPGIGEGAIILGTLANAGETTADLTAALVTGDATGSILHGTEVPLYSDILFLDFFLMNINQAAINNYENRGINNTTEDDYTVLEMDFAKETSLEFNLTFYERRLNLYYAYSDGEYQVDAIKDNLGNLITTLGEPYAISETSDRYRISFDLTDDYLDPRRGLRFDIAYEDNKADSLDEPDFYTVDFNLLGYIPFGEADTLVLNYYQSNAHVRRQGNTDPDDIRAELDTNCDPADTVCLTTEQNLVDNIISARTYGTSTSLGGDLRMRSFPQGRYQGAHMAFVGAEYRWNFTREVKPFDYFIWKDVRTGLQLVFFAEVGTVSETTTQLWQETRHSLGTGIRLLAGSGAVYRADIATGKEGTEIIIIFDYPWE